MLCEHLAPSMRALRLLGRVQQPRRVRLRARPAELAVRRRVPPLRLRQPRLLVAGRGAPVLARAGAHASRYQTRPPVGVGHRLAGPAVRRGVGIDAVPLPIVQVRSALEDGRLDALLLRAIAMLAYQWFPRLRYFTDVRAHVPDRLPGDGAAHARAADRPVAGGGAGRGQAAGGAARRRSLKRWTRRC